MKKFLIIGSIGAIIYKVVFPKIKDGEINVTNRIGFFTNGSVPCYFYTNLFQPEKPFFELTKEYNPVDYPKYDDYDVININRAADIPINYLGEMGVPVTFIEKLNRNQFEILGIANSARWIGEFPCFTIINGKKNFDRLIIKRK